MRRVSAPSARIAVIGAGTSALIHELVAAGHTSIVAVDISSVALDKLGLALGQHAGAVELACADMRSVRLDRPVDVWHDRAAFHFLVDPADRAAYAKAAARAVVPNGHVIIAAFAERGPDHCSGLPVARQTAASLEREFADAFDLVEAFEREHTTPRGVDQPFVHALLRRRAT